jgi:serine/threonine-protein kinase RsbW
MTLVLAFSRRELTLPAELSRLPEVRAFAEDSAIEYGFGGDAAYQIKSAASEAAANAIEHGSAGPADEVTLEAVEEAGSFVLYVRDCGSFRPRVSTRGDLPERGRGLQFLGQMMDEVDVRPGNGGTEVRMVKRR